MPFLFQWRMYDRRDVEWQFYDRHRHRLNPEAATKDLRQPEKVPAQEFWPLRIRQISRHKKIPDFGSLPSSGTLVVNRRARDLFESFEPGRHVYVPLEVILFTGEVVSDKYWLFRNQNWVDGGLVEDLSQVGWIKSSLPPFEKQFYSPKTINPKLVWRYEKIAGCHIWVDRLLRYNICISNELASEMRHLNLRYCDLTEGGVV